MTEAFENYSDMMERLKKEEEEAKGLFFRHKKINEYFIPTSYNTDIYFGIKAEIYPNKPINFTRDYQLQINNMFETWEKIEKCYIPQEILQGIKIKRSLTKQFNDVVSEFNEAVCHYINKCQNTLTVKIEIYDFEKQEIPLRVITKEIIIKDSYL